MSIGRRALPVLLLLLAGTASADQLEVQIVGLEGEMAGNVRATMRMVALSASADLEPLLIQRMHSRSPDEIRSALQPFGYYRPEIEATLTHADGDRWIARYVITPGTPVLLRTIDIALQGPGAEDPELLALVAAPGLASGEQLDHRDYDDLKYRLRGAAATRGYVQAAFISAALEVDPSLSVADVRLALDTGARHSFGEIVVRQDALDPEFVMRYVPIEEGEPYDTSRLIDIQYSLYDSEYFGYVEITPGTPVDGVVPVTIEAEARAKHRFTAGIGYGSNTRARLSAGWQNRRVNRHGHRFALSGQLSGVRSSATARYLIPLADPIRERLTLSTAYTDETLADVDSQSASVGISVVRHLGPWERDAYLRFQRERTTQNAVVDLATLVLPGMSFGRSASDDPVHPRHGYSFLTDLRLSPRALGSDVDFVHITTSVHLIRPAGEQGRWLLRGELGAAVVAATADLPASQRFYAGGDTSVRGYGFRSIGPVDTSGDLIGGRYLMTASIEYERGFRPNWAFATFLDLGDAFDGADFGIEAGVGIGLRWRSPVGTLRVDIAQSVTDQSLSPRLHLSIGSDL